MRRLAISLTVAIVVVACGGSDGDGSSDQVSDSAPRDTAIAATTTLPTTTTTSSPPATTTRATTAAPTSTTDPAVAAQQSYDEARNAIGAIIDEHAVPVTIIESGALSADATFTDQAEPGSLSGLALDIRVLADLDGTLWYVVLGDLDTLSNTWIEFDAISYDDVTVVAETSVVAGGNGPAWVATAPAGEVITLTPPDVADGPEGFRRGEATDPRFAYFIRGSIGVTDNLVLKNAPDGSLQYVEEISTWTYRDIAQVGRRGEGQGGQAGQFSARAAFGFLHALSTPATAPFPTVFRDPLETLRAMTDQAAAANPQSPAAKVAAANTEDVTWLDDPATSTIFEVGTAPDDGSAAENATDECIMILETNPELLDIDPTLASLCATDPTAARAIIDPLLDELPD